MPSPFERYRPQRTVQIITDEMDSIWTGDLLTEARFGHVIIVGGVIKPSPIK